MKEKMISELAAELRGAESSGKSIEGLKLRYPEMTIQDAYQIQLWNARLRAKSGEKLLGYKIGLTSIEARKHFGLETPDLGHLFEGMEWRESEPFDLSRCHQPKIECEIAFKMAADLVGSQCCDADVRAAVEWVAPAFEIVDSRIVDWKIKAEDTIADNGSSAYFIIGAKHWSIEGLDLATLGMAMFRNSEVVTTAAGAAVMGDPIKAVTFLVKELANLDLGLKKGQIVLSGSLGGMSVMQAGDVFEAEIYKLGKVSCRVSG